MNMKQKIFDIAIEGYKDIEADTYLGIFGHPIRHTLSPVIHDNLSKALGFNERYIAFDVDKDLDKRVKQAYDEGILGLNITVPYKQEVIKSLVDIDPAAQAIGAVNTLVRVDNGYKGYNTDMLGLAKAISSEGIELSGKKVIMLGAGGAARAVAYMCLEYGVETVYIINRTYENAAVIAKDMNLLAKQNGKATFFYAFSGCDYDKVPRDRYIFIQCTSVGLKESDGLPIVSDEDFYSMADAGIDLIYNPARTPFLNIIEKCGGKAMNGLKMLLYQGIMAYELWNNVSIDDGLAEYVYEKLSAALYIEKGNIILIGYMGSGKSTVGKYIAGRYGYDFLDTDECIVAKTGISINEIFEAKGEKYFRDLETQTLAELIKCTKGTVIATGGGLPIREENERYLKELGKVYYLKADADVLYKRLCNATDRPLLKGDGLYDKICSMLEARNDRYTACAGCIIEMSEASTIEEVAEAIMTVQNGL